MNITEILDSLYALNENDLQTVGNKVNDLLLNTFKKDLNQAIKIGDVICDFLHLNAFPYSWVIQTDNFPSYDCSLGNDISETFLMTGLDDFSALCDASYQNIKLCNEFIALLPNNYFCKERSADVKRTGCWHPRTFNVYKKGGSFYTIERNINKDDLK